MSSRQWSHSPQSVRERSQRAIWALHQRRLGWKRTHQGLPFCSCNGSCIVFPAREAVTHTFTPLTSFRGLSSSLLNERTPDCSKMNGDPIHSRLSRQLFVFGHPNPVSFFFPSAQLKPRPSLSTRARESLLWSRRAPSVSRRVRGPLLWTKITVSANLLWTRKFNSQLAHTRTQRSIKPGL